MPRLENWSIIFDDDPYLAPEARYTRLRGQIFDDEEERFDDGDMIRTSSIQQLDIQNNKAQTRNTLYTLGKPSEDFLNWLDENGYTLDDYQLEVSQC